MAFQPRADAKAKPSEYRVAKVLSFQESSVARSRFTGESFGEMHFATSRPYQARAQEMTIAVGEDRYTLVHEIRSKADDMSHLRPGDLLEIRIEESKHRIFIKRPDGREWKTRIFFKIEPEEAGALRHENDLPDHGGTDWWITLLSGQYDGSWMVTAAGAGRVVKAPYK